MRYGVSVEIDAAIDAIWAVLSDVERWPGWTPSMTRVERLDDGPFGLGSRVRIRRPGLPGTHQAAGAAGGGLATHRVHPRSVVHLGREERRVTSTAEHQLIARAGNPVTARLGIEQHGPLAPLVRPFIAGLTRRYVQMEAQELKRRCEER